MRIVYLAVSSSFLDNFLNLKAKLYTQSKPCFQFLKEYAHVSHGVLQFTC